MNLQIPLYFYLLQTKIDFLVGSSVAFEDMPRLVGSVYYCNAQTKSFLLSTRSNPAFKKLTEATEITPMYWAYWYMSIILILRKKPLVWFHRVRPQTVIPSFHHRINQTSDEVSFFQSTGDYLFCVQ